MLTLPAAIMALLEPFRPVFHLSTWVNVQVLLVGSILAPGKRTVTSALRAVGGLADDAGFSKYHQVLIRDPQQRYDPMARLCTNSQYSPEQLLAWFVRRWSMEVTFEETRAHLGVETQRQWSDLAILRSTPALFF